MGVFTPIFREEVIIELTKLYLARTGDLHKESNTTLEDWLNEMYPNDGGYQIVE